MKALLINPPLPDRWDRRSVPPLGLGYIAAYARESGHWVELVDGNSDIPWSVAELVNLAVRNDYQVVGISTLTDTLPLVIQIALEIKAIAPRVIIVLGGPHATLAHRELLEEHLCLDAVVRGDGELAFTEILDHLQKDCFLTGIIPGVSTRCNSKVEVGPERPAVSKLDELPNPSRDFISLPRNTHKANKRFQTCTFYDPVRRIRKKATCVCSSRGCPYTCSFCATSALFSMGGWRARSAESVCAEVQELHEKLDVHHIFFVDSNFFVDMKRAEEISERFRLLAKNITFSFCARADQLIRAHKILSKLKANGCRSIEIGVESGSDAVLKRFNKGITVQQNSLAIELLKASGILVGVDFIMFDPDTTLNDLRKNIAFLRRHDFFGYSPPLLYQELRLFPHTPIRKQMKRDGRVDEGIHVVPKWEFKNSYVSSIYKKVLDFRDRYQEKIQDMEREIGSLVYDIFALQLYVKSKNFLIKLQKEVTRCEFASLCLRRMPYILFEQLVERFQEPSRNFQDSDQISDAVCRLTLQNITFAEETLYRARKLVDVSL
jgi:radical SAM superfamily enzyme YgiQ (UPF0313 family)